MDRFGTSLLLIMFIYSGCQCQRYEIVPDGTVWLGENVTLMVNIPNMQRPVVWQSRIYTYECDIVCADSDDYKVTQTGDISKLWIREVARSFSKWKVLDKNKAGGEIILDIKVKPKIEIKKNANCEYYVEAHDSYPVTSIECFNENRPLKFTSLNHTKSSDGITISNAGALRFTEFLGNVTCGFTIGEIFRETRRFEVECKVPPEKLNILESAFLFASGIILTMAVIAVKLLCETLKGKKEDLKFEIESGKVSDEPESVMVSKEERREEPEESQRESQDPQSTPESQKECQREPQEPQSIAESQKECQREPQEPQSTPESQKVHLETVIF